MGRVRVETENLDAGSPNAEAIAILDHYLTRLRKGERISGLVILVERDDMTYEAKMTSCESAATRIGRVELLKTAVIDQAVEG